MLIRFIHGSRLKVIENKTGLRAENYGIHAFDWLKSILKVV